MQWNKSSKFGDIEYPELAVKNFKSQVTSNGVCLSGDFIFAVQGRYAISKGAIQYLILRDGSLIISQQGRVSEVLPFWLPRYGYSFVLKADGWDIQYLGLGPGECYEDKKNYVLPGIYSYVCDETAEMYERPQECGSRCETRWVKFANEENLFEVTGDKYAFSATHYDMHQIAKAAHLNTIINLFTDMPYRYATV